MLREGETVKAGRHQSVHFATGATRVPGSSSPEALPDHQPNNKQPQSKSALSGASLT
jgi:hypothetical protein